MLSDGMSKELSIPSLIAHAGIIVVVVTVVVAVVVVVGSGVVVIGPDGVVVFIQTGQHSPATLTLLNPSPHGSVEQSILQITLFSKHWHFLHPEVHFSYGSLRTLADSS